jgi:hypothetical protein
MQLVSSVSPLNESSIHFPVPQSLQEVVPVESAYFPATQSVQSAEFTLPVFALAVPIGHGSHRVRPALVPYLPVGHGSSCVAAVFTPFEEESEAKFPGVTWVHAELASATLLKYPSVHAEHALPLGSYPAEQTHKNVPPPPLSHSSPVLGHIPSLIQVVSRSPHTDDSWRSKITPTKRIVDKRTIGSSFGPVALTFLIRVVV